MVTCKKTNLQSVTIRDKIIICRDVLNVQTIQITTVGNLKLTITEIDNIRGGNVQKLLAGTGTII